MSIGILTGSFDFGIKKVGQVIKTMGKINDYIEKWKKDFDFKTFFGAGTSFLANVVFALFNGFLGIYYSSLWYGTVCIYYLVLVIIRGFILVSEKKMHGHNERTAKRNKVYVTAAGMLLVLNITLIMPVSLMVRLQKPVYLTLIPAIAMAAYTTYNITMASINLKKRQKSANCLVKLLRTIDFIDSLVSLLTLQNTLIMVNKEGNPQDMLGLTAISSAVIFAGIMALSVAALVKGVQRVKHGEGQK